MYVIFCESDRPPWCPSPPAACTLFFVAGFADLFRCLIVSSVCFSFCFFPLVFTNSTKSVLSYLPNLFPFLEIRKSLCLRSIVPWILHVFDSQSTLLITHVCSSIEIGTLIALEYGLPDPSVCLPALRRGLTKYTFWTRWPYAWLKYQQSLKNTIMRSIIES